MRFLLEEPNPYMTCQQFLEKMARQRELSGNAFAVIARDGAGLPCGLYPLDAFSVEASYDGGGDLFLTFSMLNGTRQKFPYSDIIHLRRDYYNNDIFIYSFKILYSVLLVVAMRLSTNCFLLFSDDWTCTSKHLSSRLTVCCGYYFATSENNRNWIRLLDSNQHIRD